MKKIDIYEIPEEGLSLHLEDAGWISPDVEQRGPASADVHLQRTEKRVMVSGSFSVTVVNVCDRCLKQFEQAVTGTFAVDLELLEEGLPAEKVDMDHFCHEGEMDMDFLQGRMVDIVDILQQQVYLAMPMKKLCAEQCRGICSGCGANLNTEPCRCEAGSDTPFAVLAKLK